MAQQVDSLTQRFLDPSVMRLILEHFKNVSNLNIQVEECLRYLFLLSKYREQTCSLFFPLVQSVDEIWHFLIIQTREYHRLCEQLPGSVFLHHRSKSYKDYEEEQSDRETLLRSFFSWIPLYCKEFGGFCAESGPYWKVIHYLHNKRGLSFEEIHNLSA